MYFYTTNYLEHVTIFELFTVLILFTYVQSNYQVIVSVVFFATCWYATQQYCLIDLVQIITKEVYSPIA